MNLFIYSDDHPESNNKETLRTPAQADRFVEKHLANNNPFDFIKCFDDVTSEAEHSHIDRVIISITQEAGKVNHSHEPTVSLLTNETPQSGDLIIYTNGAEGFDVVEV